MLDKMFPLYAAIIACVFAQMLKPVCYWIIHRKWNNYLFFAAGGMPSSHAALVSSLCLAVGLQEKFSSTIFAITISFSLIICFDAANVRYYSGQNIRLTKHLIDDLVERGEIDLESDPVYTQKMKEVLGHTYLEVFGGIIVGLITSYAYYLLFTIR